MSEFVQAMRAIWASWENGTRLDFRGDYYSHTLITPFFSPPPTPFGAPRVFVAAVGTVMTEVAGANCDGVILHPFTTERYVREVSVPALERGFGKGGRDADAFETACMSFVATGRNEDELAAMTRHVRDQIAFYGSTPTYRAVLELHGWGELGDQLHSLSVSDDADKWKKMSDAIDDTVLTTFAVVGEPDEVGPELGRRFAGVVDRVSFYSAHRFGDAELWAGIAAGLRTAAGGAAA